MNYERNSRGEKKTESFIITRAKISAVRAVRRLLTLLSQMRLLIEGGAYSGKYGTSLSFDTLWELQ